MIKTFYTLVAKNCKNLFRNWASILLLIVGPLVILLIMIVAFSDISFHGITIGYIGDHELVQPIIGRMDYLGNFQQYPVLEDCLLQLKQQKVHLCLDLKNYQSTYIDLYYDNTRGVISLMLISQLREGISREKENILRNKTHSLISGLDEIQNFIKDKQGNIQNIISSLEGYKLEIATTQNEMLVIKNDIDFQINELNIMKNDLHTLKDDIDYGYSKFNQNRNSIYQTQNQLQNIRNNLINLNQDTAVIDQAIYALDSLQSGLSTIQYTIVDAQNKVINTISKIDRAISSLQNAKTFIILTDDKLSNIKSSLTGKISELSILNGELNHKNQIISKTANIDVENMVNPFLLDIKPMFQDSKRVQVFKETYDLSLPKRQTPDLTSIDSVQTLLPFLISILICFVSIMISNIIILDEKHSPAYTRNLISPISGFIHILSILFTILIILLIMISIVLGVSYIVFFLDITQSIATILTVTIFLILIYSLWGIALGFIINSTTTSLLITTFFMIINVFLSGAIFPVERMSKIILEVSSFIPFRDGLSILQQSIFYNIPLTSFVPQIINMSIILGFSIIVLMISYSISKTRFKQGI